MRYDWKIGATKALKFIVIFLVPVLVDNFIVAFPEIAQLTVGGLLVFLVNWLKIQFDVKWL